MKLLLSTLSLFVCSLVNAQTFNTTTAVPFDLDGGTNYASCASPGTKAFSFTVSGVGTLNTSTNQLAEIDIRLNAACGGNLQDVACYLKSPSGTCLQIASQMGTTTNYSGNPTTYLDYAFRNAVSCLNKAPDYAAFPATVPSEASLDGRFGIFSTVGNLATVLNGQNANGTWTLYFFESTANAPCVESASLLFGDPTVSNQTPNGDNCVTAILWDGSPICASTNGKTSSTNMPGWNGATFTGCQWNAANNNDVWIKFQATSTSVCLAISGLVDNLQSVIVTDPNADGDGNPCTGAGNGTYWTNVNCPRTSDNIYAAVTGTTRNQNHCFTATVGQMYYLVVDGNGGAESPFYITGINGLNEVLPIELVEFSASCSDKFVELNWLTATERNNDYFVVERSTDGMNWEKVSTVQGQINSDKHHSYQITDYTLLPVVSYYRLKQVDLDGRFSYSNIVSIDCFKNQHELRLMPNPTNGEFYLTGLNEREQITILNAVGEEITSVTAKSITEKMHLEGHAAGLYYIRVMRNNGTIETLKIVLY